MATTPRSPLNLDAQTPEEIAKLRELMKIQDDLQQAMTNRRQLFDPVLLAMAQGFLAPTKTGSFGESIANAAALVGPAQAQEEKRQLEIGQIRAELARNQLGMMQQQRESQNFQRIIGGGLPAPQGLAAPAQANPPSGPQARGVAPSEGLPEGPPIARAPLAEKGEPVAVAEVLAQAGPTAQTQPGASPVARAQDTNTLFDTLRAKPDLVAALANSRDPRAKSLLDAFKNYETLRIQGEATQGQLMQMEEVNVPNLGTVRLPRSVARLYFDALARGKTLDAIQIIRRYTGEVPVRRLGTSGNLEGVPGVDVGPERIPQQSSGARGQPIGVPNTVEGRLQAQKAFETQEAIRQAEGIERVKNDLKVEDEIHAAATAARSLIDSTNTIIKYASDPKTKGTLGQFKEFGILGGLAGLVTEGLRVGSTTIGIAGLDQAIRTAFKTTTEIRAAEILAREVGFTNLTFGKVFMQGQGAVSNYERGLVNTLGGDLGDTAEGLRAKAEMIQARAKFDIVKRDALREARSRGLSVRDLEQTEAYKNGLQTYEKELERIRDSILSIRPEGARPNRPGPPAGGSPNPALAPAPVSPAAPSPAARPPAAPPRDAYPFGFRPG